MLTLFYTRGELGLRIALFFGSAVVAAAFSGLLAYGVFHIEHTALKGWQYLFLIGAQLHTMKYRAKTELTLVLQRDQ